jgi:hypothetical protein
MRRSFWTATVVIVLSAHHTQAEAPVASYIFPAGGQRGKPVDVRVGGLFLHKSCSFEMLGPGVEASKQLQRTHTLWLEGPLLPLPDSQQAEDYPKDMAGRVTIAADAPLGMRYWRLWTSQGATPAMKFQVGDLPEVVEEEIAGDPVPTLVKLPVTINGRIFPREDVDLWSFKARKGQTVLCEVNAARLGSPLDAHLEILGPEGRRLAEADGGAAGDPVLGFTAPADGMYQVRIHDVRLRGGQAYLYRLTLTTGPHVDSTYPLGGRRGHKVRLELIGQDLPHGPVEVSLPAAGPRDFVHRLEVAGQRTNDFLLDLDDLVEHLEVEPNDEPARVKPVSVPAVLNGRIDRPGDVDHWAWSARKGEVFELDLRAARLGSPLDGVLTVLDRSGKELARADSPGPQQPDPLLRFQAPADGTYLVRVQDRFASRGGPAFGYRLRVAPPVRPDFRLNLQPDALTLPRGGQAKLKLQAERLGGFAGPIPLDIAGLPKGVTFTPAALAAGQGAVEITFKADKDSAIGASRLTIRGTATSGGKPITRTAEAPMPRGLPALDIVLLAVALPTPFKIKGEYQVRWVARGTSYERRYQIERGGYSGPIELSLTDRQARHLQGVTGPTITVPAGATEFTYPVRLPPWMEMGRTSRVCVMGVGVVKDQGGREHEVSFSSTAQNEQLVAVVEPGPLGVEVERSSVAAAPGQAVVLPVKVARGKALKGPVRVELIVPAHVRGVSAAAVEVLAGQDRAALTIRFAFGRLGPFNMPLTIRATLTDNGRPVVAEARVEVLPPP